MTRTATSRGPTTSITTTNCLGPDNFYKPGYLCAAHVVSIADPAMYGNHSRYNSQERYNKELKLQHEKEKKDKLKDEIRAIQDGGAML